MTTPAHAQTPTRFVARGGGDRPVAWLRFGSALVVSAGSAWLLYVEPARWWLAAIGILGGVFWIRRALPVLRRSADAITSEIELDADALVLKDASDERRVAWREVAAIEVDEDRLVVRVRLLGAHTPKDDVILEPVYPGVSVYALHAAVDRAWRSAREVAS